MKIDERRKETAPKSKIFSITLFGAVQY